jgi:hypothetical protein
MLDQEVDDGGDDSLAVGTVDKQDGDLVVGYDLQPESPFSAPIPLNCTAPEGFARATRIRGRKTWRFRTVLDLNA